MKVKPRLNSTPQEIGGTIGLFPMEKYINPHTKIISVKNYQPNITIQYFKNTLSAIYKQPREGGRKIEYLIEAKSAREIRQIIEQKKKEIKGLLDTALFKFARACNLLLFDSRPIWSRYEDYHRADDYIDALPQGMVIHSQHFKKVYGQGIEFIASRLKDEPTLKIENYITNQALTERLPNLITSIDTLKQQFTNFVTSVLTIMEERQKVDRELAINIRTHNRVFLKLDRLLSHQLHRHRHHRRHR